LRLDYYLAHAANLSRKEAKIAIAKGRVIVNGEDKLKANTGVADTCNVMLDKVSLSFQLNRYYMMHKPAGLVCALQDDEHPVVLGLVPHEIQKELKIVGRLDKDTTGLLLLTTDGQWLHKVTSPKHDCPKTYLVDLVDAITDEAVAALEQGVLLNGESDLTKAAHVVVHTETQISLTISEGKYHQVKRMLAAVGNKVEGLHRTHIGSVALGDDLALGEFKALSPEQVASLA